MTKMSKAGHIKHPIILGLLTCLSSPSKHPYDAPKMFFKIDTILQGIKIVL